MDCPGTVTASSKRSANFSSAEESLLIMLVKRYKNIIECKKTDTTTLKEKAECWKTLEKDFNSTSGEVFRPKEVLKKKFDNIKKRVKQKFANEKCYMRGTGGGPPRNHLKYVNALEEEVKEILGTRLEGMKSEFDDDAEDDCQIANKNKAPNYLECVPFEREETIDNSLDAPSTSEVVGIEHSYSTAEVTCQKENGNWGAYTPKMLQSKKPKALTTKNVKCKEKDTKSVRDKVSQWAEAKGLLEDAKQRFVHEEHALKLQQMRERHEEEMRILKEKNILEMEIMKKEHEMRMQILKKNLK